MREKSVGKTLIELSAKFTYFETSSIKLAKERLVSKQLVLCKMGVGYWQGFQRKLCHSSELVFVKTYQKKFAV